MTANLMQHYLEHPQDVLAQWLDWQAYDPVALVVITRTEGGAVREAGALMAVTADGRAAGYISGGCLDADVILQARQALEADETRHLRYGSGSPFIDLPLPCGGAIELAIIPHPDTASVETCHDRLKARKAATLAFYGAGFTARYAPKLRLRIAGRGADPLALARLARTSGIETVLQLRDGEDVAAAKADGFEHVTALELPSDLPSISDDPWTAFILMFHDSDWEAPLLKQALEGRAFYTGAVGSRRTHERRCNALRAEGFPHEQVARIRGPVGLVPSMRDASMLAASVFAEIISVFHDPARRVLAQSAIILLAAGASSRFEHGDKLLALYRNKRILEYTAECLRTDPASARIAITAPGDKTRAEVLEAAGWHVSENPQAHTGQASSLRCGLEATATEPGINTVLIMLADMPGVPNEHLRRLAREMAKGNDAVMTESNGTLSPPAMFKRDTFDELMKIDGDRGAKSVFKRLEHTATVTLDPAFAFDIDTSLDLINTEEASHA